MSVDGDDTWVAIFFRESFWDYNISMCEIQKIILISIYKHSDLA